MPTDDRDKRATQPDRAAVEEAKEKKAAEDEASREQSGVFGSERPADARPTSGTQSRTDGPGGATTHSDMRDTHEPGARHAPERSPAYKAREAEVRKALDSGDAAQIEAQRTALANDAGMDAQRTVPENRERAVRHPEGAITVEEFRELDAMLRDANPEDEFSFEKAEEDADAETATDGSDVSPTPGSSTVGGGPTRNVRAQQGR